MVQRVYQSWCGGERDTGQRREQRVERKRHRPGAEKTATERGGSIMVERRSLRTIFFFFLGNCTFLSLTIEFILILHFIYKTEQCSLLCIENIQMVWKSIIKSSPTKRQMVWKFVNYSLVSLWISNFSLSLSLSLWILTKNLVQRSSAWSSSKA
jgi:hypothetical protein